MAEFDAIVGAHGLTFARYEALVLLTFSRDGTLADVADRRAPHGPPTSATNTVPRLEAQGLVQRHPNPNDGRGTLVPITAAGRAVVEDATADLVAAGFGLTMLDTE